MDKKILTRIFEPYFTTKEKGKGTGLGLAMVHGIVKSHGGHITVYSEPGKGTNVHVYLPQMLLETATPGIAGKEALPGGSERVLIVDDEDIVVQMEGKMLESLGYAITALTDSLEAWDLLCKKPNAFDLVITDMTMPKMTGVELAQRYFSIRPGALVILCTGFSELVTEEKAKSVGISEFIMKPVVKKDLAKAVRKVLDKNKSQAV
jgi:CheY-like chemotaxis protein